MLRDNGDLARLHCRGDLRLYLRGNRQLRQRRHQRSVRDRVEALCIAPGYRQRLDGGDGFPRRRCLGEQLLENQMFQVVLSQPVL